MDLKGSQTEKNLHTAFAGETQARSKYDYYASKADSEGYRQIGAIFSETANNEKEHAKMWFKYLRDGVPTTPDNLQNAIEGEHYEWSQMYAEFARVAREEGFTEIATAFQEIGEVEEEHERRYQALLNNIKNNKVFHRDQTQRWHCRNCGYVYEGTAAPERCPACKHPQAHFELLAQNY